MPSAPPVRADAAFSLKGFACSLVKLGVKKGAARLVAYLTDNPEIRVFSSALAGDAAQELCNRELSKLKPIAARAVSIRPSLRARVGAYAYDVYASHVTYSGGQELLAPHWFDWDPARDVRYYVLWYQYDYGSWQPMRGHIRLWVPLRHVVRFAVAVHDSAGWSPYAYSVLYRAE